jgi:plastocyanin
MIDFGYQPAQLTGRVGQQLTLSLRNTGATPHTFTITGLVDSGVVAAGATGQAQFTPTATGTLTYFCTVHGQAAMSGTLTVSASTSLSPADADQMSITSNAVAEQRSV